MKVAKYYALFSAFIARVKKALDMQQYGKKKNYESRYYTIVWYEGMIKSRWHGRVRVSRCELKGRDQNYYTCMLLM